MSDLETLRETLRSILNEGGINDALAFLNKRVDHRFSAIYRLDGSNLRMVHFYDREGTDQPLEVLKVVPFKHSLCHLAVRDGEFDTQDARLDPEVSPSGFRRVMISYVGFPLVKPNGELYGTFCHFDLVPREVSEEEIEFLGVAVEVLQGYISA